MGFPIRICSICSEEFELKPDKPGFANRCPDCSTADDSLSPRQRGGDKQAQGDAELNAARKKAMRDLLYRRDS